jgi:hypothetical protein
MPYAFSYEVPGNPEIYAAVKAAIGPEVPHGLVTQLVIRVEHGLQHLMVWDEPASWDHFRTSRVEPAVRRVLNAAGVQAPTTAPEITTLDLVDLWVPAPQHPVPHPA